MATLVSDLLANDAAPSAALPTSETTQTALPPALPPYTQNLLRVKVTVQVILAQKKLPVGSIIELVPGSIIQFNKACDEMLDLEVSHHRAAQGECIKVGDKFGLRVTSIVLPEERFGPLVPQQAPSAPGSAPPPAPARNAPAAGPTPTSTRPTAG